MDLDASFVLHQLEDIEDDVIDDGSLTAGIAMVVMALRAIETHRLRTERREPIRLYLCHPQLVRNPRGATV